MAKLSSFTQQEKDACVPVIDLMVECANMARAKGVLALEEWVAGREPFMVFLINLIVDGTDPEIVEDLGRTLIEADGHTGEELLRRLLIFEGVLGVQCGLNARLLDAKLSAMLGERFLTARGHISPDTQGEIPAEELSMSELSSLLDGGMASTQPAPPACEHFCEVFRMLDNRDIQLVLRETDQMDFVLTLRGCDGALADNMLANCSKRLASTIMEEMKALGEVPEEAILAAQERMMHTLRRLQDMGEVLRGD